MEYDEKAAIEEMESALRAKRTAALEPVTLAKQEATLRD